MGFIGKSISRKLIAVTLLFVIIIFAMSGFLSNHQVKGILVDEAKCMLMKDSQIVAKQINEFMEKNKYLVETKKDGDIMNKKKDEIVAVIENISASAEETSASMEEISASSEEQLASIENLFSVVNVLKDLADQLKKVLQGFKI